MSTCCFLTNTLPSHIGVCSADWASICSVPGGRLIKVNSADELQLREAFHQALLHLRLLVVRDNTTGELRHTLYKGWSSLSQQAVHHADAAHWWKHIHSWLCCSFLSLAQSKVCMRCAAGPLEGAVALDTEVASLIKGLITDGKP